MCIHIGVRSSGGSNQLYNGTLRCQKAIESGFKGLSILHRLHALYDFNVLEDFVFDAMHTILLGNIKKHLDFYKEKSYLNDNVESCLGKFPWTAGTYYKVDSIEVHKIPSCKCITMYAWLKCLQKASIVSLNIAISNGTLSTCSCLEI